MCWDLPGRQPARPPPFCPAPTHHNPPSHRAAAMVMATRREASADCLLIRPICRFSQAPLGHLNTVVHYIISLSLSRCHAMTCYHTHKHVRVCVCMCVHVCVCVCTCVCVCVRTYMCARAHVCVFLYVCTHVRVCVRPYVHVLQYIRVWVFTHGRMWTGVYVM